MMQEECSTAEALLRTALQCFDRAKDEKLKYRASAQLDAILLRQRMQRYEGKLKTEDEREMVDIMARLAKSDLFNEVMSICEEVSYRSCAPTEFHNSIITQFL